jgi:DNA-binding NarL/FixJ family response regulator
VTVRVLLADDHPLFLDGLRLLLETAGVEVVGTACNGHELLELADRVAADVAVVDLDMPGVDGTGATAHLARRHPNLAVLVLTMHDDDTSVRRALHAGARGYVVKDAGHGAVVRAVHAVADGDTVLSGGVGRTVLTTAAGRRPTSPFAELTEREREVLELIARGQGNAAIAEQLYLSLKTVQQYVSNGFEKLHMTSRAEAVARARDVGAEPSRETTDRYSRCMDGDGLHRAVARHQEGDSHGDHREPRRQRSHAQHGADEQRDPQAAADLGRPAQDERHPGPANAEGDERHNVARDHRTQPGRRHRRRSLGEPGEHEHHRPLPTGGQGRPHERGGHGARSGVFAQDRDARREGQDGEEQEQQRDQADRAGSDCHRRGGHGQVVAAGDHRRDGQQPDAQQRRRAGEQGGRAQEHGCPRTGSLGCDGAHGCSLSLWVSDGLFPPRRNAMNDRDPPRPPRGTRPPVLAEGVTLPEEGASDPANG